MSTMEPAFDAEIRIRRVRIGQVALVATGVVSGFLPVLVQVRDSLHLNALMYAAFGSVLLVPIAYAVFAYTVGSAVRAFTPPEAAPRSTVAYALFVGAPCVGAALETVLLFQLAKQTALIDGSRHRPSLVLGLSIVRCAVLWLSGIFVVPLLAFFGFDQGMVVLYTILPLLSFAVLGVITQIIVTPLLDQLVPEESAVRLGGIGGNSPMAVPSSSGDEVDLP